MQNPESSLHTSQSLCKSRRAQLFSQFQKTHHPYCHKSVNKEFAQTGLTYKTRDNKIQLRNSSIHATTIFKTSYPVLNHTNRSYKDIEGTKTMWKSAMLAYKNDGEKDEEEKTQEKLGDGHPSVANVNISTLSKQHITGNHTRTTNPGYARNALGGFYTK